MRKVFLCLSLVLVIALYSNDGAFYNYYENLNIEQVTALSSNTGNYLFDLIPVDTDNIDTKLDYMIAVSAFVKQTGEEYGNNSVVSNGENVDFLKHLSFLFKYERKLLPFIAYHTPYKSFLNYNDEREIIKKTDALSFGFISELSKHQVGMSLDVLMSTYKQMDGISEYVRRKGGFSGRIHINLKVNKRSSMFGTALSPVFFKYDIDDFKKGDDDFEYLNNLEVNVGFKYKYRSVKVIYSLLYRDHNKIIDTFNGRLLTYPWTIEHNFIFGYTISKTFRISVDYQLLPVCFTENMPILGDKYRHTIGAFLGCDFDNISLNMRLADSKLLSESSFARNFVQFDLIYKIK